VIDTENSQQPPADRNVGAGITPCKDLDKIDSLIYSAADEQRCHVETIEMSNLSLVDFDLSHPAASGIPSAVL